MGKWTSTVIAVAVGIIGGVIGLIVLAVVLVSTRRTTGDWILYIAVGLGILGIVELTSWRKKRRAREALGQPPQIR